MSLKAHFQTRVQEICAVLGFFPFRSSNNSCKNRLKTRVNAIMSYTKIFISIPIIQVFFQMNELESSLFLTIIFFNETCVLDKTHKKN